YRLAINFETKEIALEDQYRSHKRVCDMDPLQPVDVRIFVLDTAIECFVNDAFCFTMRAYDRTNGDLALEAENADCVIRGLAISTLGDVRR
ncbi:MAG: hypothetical protein K1Y02_12125, partial [Candidatus Hydrogenedentes bacterium]|nr:hypothetical protein [Candidatus Hydrogenedentota bacterium]